MSRTDPCLQCSALAGQALSLVPVWWLETSEKLRVKVSSEVTYERQLGGLGSDYSHLTFQKALHIPKKDNLIHVVY